MFEDNLELDTISDPPPIYQPSIPSRNTSIPPPYSIQNLEISIVHKKRHDATSCIIAIICVCIGIISLYLIIGPIPK